jgi:phosphoglycolate phosphatase
LPYKLVIFDFDGTLADSISWVVEALDAVADRYGFRKAGPEERERLRGLGSREIMRELGVPVWKLPLIAGYMRRLAAEAAHRIVLHPGIAAMLTDLHARGVQLAVASSNAEANIRRIMGADLAATIGTFECGAAMFGKAQRLKRILARSGVTAAQAIYIGDETRDIEAARQAGIAAGGVLWGVANRAAFDIVAPKSLFASVDEMARALAPN